VWRGWREIRRPAQGPIFNPTSALPKLTSLKQEAQKEISVWVINVSFKMNLTRIFSMHVAKMILFGNRTSPMSPLCSLPRASRRCTSERSPSGDVGSAASCSTLSLSSVEASMEQVFRASLRHRFDRSKAGHEAARENVLRRAGGVGQLKPTIARADVASLKLIHERYWGAATRGRCVRSIYCMT
jgi:hypothetical protein